jgi:glycosyltransferase involved in cell wall biosynthesis
VCTSHAERRELAHIVPALEGRLRVVPNGVELPAPPDPHLRAEVRTELGLADRELAVLFLGELEQRKGPLEAIAGVEQARAAGTVVTLLIAGSGPLDAQVRAHAGEAVRPLGFREDPLRLLSGVDAFVLPSKREGHSFALLEAMAHGLPVVVAAGGGSGEAVGDTGILVGGPRDLVGDPRDEGVGDAGISVGGLRGEEVGDAGISVGSNRTASGGEAGVLAGELADAFSRLAGDPDLRNRLGAAARARVKHEFTPERLRAGVREAYERALTVPARAADGATA